jgi:hypothetical protein
MRFFLVKGISSISDFPLFPQYAVILLVVVLCGCHTIPLIRETRTVDEISRLGTHNKFIKAHMRDGRVYIMHSWVVDTTGSALHGYGSLLDINRKKIQEIRKVSRDASPVANGFHVALQDISLIESNYIERSKIAGLTVVTGVSAIMTIYCAMNPKVCFGSCPTFYADDGDSLALQAEGFSTSISPSLERNDIDMLYSAVPQNDFEMVVTNEALETHCIRQANLLLFRKDEGERIFASEAGTFYRTRSPLAPVSMRENADVVNKLSKPDRDEYFSLADPENLNSKEEIELQFQCEADGPVGLVLGKRQTLMTTYLMYQGLAYMGNTVTYWMSELERGNVQKRPGVFELLGGIEVFILDDNGKWNLCGGINETGPIATDFNVIPMGNQKKGNARIKLRMNKGLWRIDYVALVTLIGKTTPDIVYPRAVATIRGSESEPFRKLLDPDSYLVTYPGEAYKISYTLPYTNAELFLDSKGYYLEWIRNEWVREQNLRSLKCMITEPARYLKSAAAEYKKLEPSMEEAFWNSRYEQK